MAFPRGSGILLHLTSLPGRGGIGDLGEAAYRFVEFLARGRQRYWQLLPLGPTGEGDSPYQSFSAFAGNPLLISLDPLAKEGWLTEGEARPTTPFPTDHVDYEAVSKWKLSQLKIAFERFEAQEMASPDMERFFAMAAGWLEEFAFFQALKDHHGGRPWDEWEPGVRDRDPEALGRYRDRLADSIGFHRFVQFEFFRQFSALKADANQAGIALIGDMPIFVAYDSADVWAHQNQFLLDRHGRPQAVAGVPPDYFSADGQVWGNPLYRWDIMARRGFGWWEARMRMALALFDLVRIDHFRGFSAAWAIPPRDKTAVRGRWLPAPGRALFDTLTARLGPLPIIAEDLGVITPDVVALRDRYGFPGMKVLQFAFGSDDRNPYLPRYHIPNNVVYTGTHDNDTTRGWYKTTGRRERMRIAQHTGTDGRRISLDLMRAALGSPAAIAITPLQDLLELGSEARMNTPGIAAGNWRWRVNPGALTAELAAGLNAFTAEHER